MARFRNTGFNKNNWIFHHNFRIRTWIQPGKFKQIYYQNMLVLKFLWKVLTFTCSNKALCLCDLLIWGKRCFDGWWTIWLVCDERCGQYILLGWIPDPVYAQQSKKDGSAPLMVGYLPLLVWTKFYRGSIAGHC